MVKTTADGVKVFLIVIILLLATPLYSSAPGPTEEQEFLTSFLKHYEFGPEGRYVHEYHPFVLKKTRESFLGLEKAICEKEMSLEGRMIILGYEEQGVPGYYTDFMQPKIDDEAMVKGKAGWSQKLHNKFGFMTGFLLKDVNAIAHNHQLGDRQVFVHINSDDLLIFHDRASVFQEHAFGQALPLIMSTKSHINKCIVSENSREVLRSLVPFWEMLYSGALKVGNLQIAGTQDILFSIEYGRYVLSSKTPVRRCFIGPDITYPIEIFAKQKKGVTRNSQAFVKQFVPNLKPINDEPTVYIFCSFVDGVGKSTMLGNIKNWMKHGSNVNMYDHVDNSSSQLAELFKFDNKVFIADLPAQLSHSTYKPDGLVYVDVRTAISEEQYKKIDAVIIPQKQALVAKYKADLLEVRNTMIHESPHAPSLLENHPKHFLRNLILLKKDRDNTWIPVRVEDKEYLFDMADDGEYRVLLPLGNAKSEGLKNIQADQMLFVDGVRLPLPYDSFVNDLVTRLQGVGIKRVVFVDFLSMYPRSSRENIRVNYLLQQLSLLDHKFDVNQSLYRSFVTGGELLYCLLQPSIYERIVHGLELEAQVRWQLYSMIADRKEGTLNGYTEQALTEKLRQDIATTHKNQAYGSFRKELQTKLNYEKRQLTELYGKAKSFVNVQLFSMIDAYNFYTALQNCMTTEVASPLLERVWQGVGRLPELPELQYVDQGLLENIETVTSVGKRVKIIYKIHETCKAEVILAPFLRLMRLSWLTTILNFFGGSTNPDKTFSIKDPMFPTVPLHLVPGLDGYWYLVQESFPSFDDQDTTPEYASVLSRLLGITAPKKIEFVVVDKTACATATAHVPTHIGIFDYDCTLIQNKTTYSESAMTKLVRKIQKDSSVNKVTPLIEAWNGLQGHSAWNTDFSAVKAKAKKREVATPEKPNGLYEVLYPEVVVPTEQESKKALAYTSTLPIPRSIKNLLIGDLDWQEGIIRLGLRMWFTLDMMVKDSEGELIVRTLNKDDIAASVTFLEAFVMPKYLGLCFEHNLFLDDYSIIEPFPSREYWSYLEPRE